MSRSWTPLPHFCGGRAYLRMNWLGTLGLLCALLLSACGESTPGGYSNSPSSSSGSETLQPIVAPPHASDSPLAPGMTGAEKGPDGLPLLQPIKGVNTALFAEKVSNEDARMDRLENAVQELRNDFDNMAPSIVRLVAIEGDIQNLIKQLEVLTNGGTPSEIMPIEESALDEPVQVDGSQTPLPEGPLVSPDAPPSDTGDTPDPLPPVPLLSQAPPAQEASTETASGAPAAPETPPPPVANGPPAIPAAGGLAVEAIRIGQHPGKTRIVLDVSGKTTYTADLDNDEKILVIELPDAAWNTDVQKDIADNPMIASYRTEKRADGKGTMLILQLKGTTSIGYKGVMDNENGKGQRIIIDLMAT